MNERPRKRIEKPGTSHGAWTQTKRVRINFKDATKYSGDLTSDH